MEELEKWKKALIYDFGLIIAVDVIIMLVFNFGTIDVISILDIVLMVAGIIFTKNVPIVGGIIGIIVGVLLIITFSIMQILLGALILIHSILFLAKYGNIKKAN